MAFLDEGDLVTADWAERFAEGAARAPGKLVRSVCFARHARRRAPAEEVMGTLPVTLTKPLAEFGESFDVLSSLAMDATPISSFAMPRSLVTELHMGFDEQLVHCAQWDFLVRAALVVGVEDTGHVTSIKLRWDDTDSTPGAVPPEAREREYVTMFARLDATPLLLPAGSATELSLLGGNEGLAKAFESDRAELEEMRGALAEARETLRRETVGMQAHVAYLERRAQQAERARDELLTSEFWRLTAPLRALVTRIRGHR